MVGTGGIAGSGAIEAVPGAVGGKVASITSAGDDRHANSVNVTSKTTTALARRKIADAFVESRPEPGVRALLRGSRLLRGKSLVPRNT